MKYLSTVFIVGFTLIAIVLTPPVLLGSGSSEQERLTAPFVSEQVSPIQELQLSDTAYATVRKPPGKGPFPMVMFLHGGLGQLRMAELRTQALYTPTQTRLLAWGYATVNATRRSIELDPQDSSLIDDVMALLDALRKDPAIDTDSLALWGASGGGSLALEMAGQTPLAAVIAGEPASIIYTGMFTKEHVLVSEEGRRTGDRRTDVMEVDPKALYTPELQRKTRDKMRQISCPILILHGDKHVIKRVNFEVVVPELKAMGKNVELLVYPGEGHGFHLNQSFTAQSLKAAHDADAFLRKYIRVKPSPIDSGLCQLLSVEELQGRRGK